MQLLAAFQTDCTTVVDLESRRLIVQWGSLLVSAPSVYPAKKLKHSQRLEFSECRFGRGRFVREGFGPDDIRALKHGLSNNTTLQALLILDDNDIGDAGIRRLADYLVGSTTMDTLVVTNNNITANGLPDITRMLESRPQLETLDFSNNHQGIIMEHFVSTLHQHASVQTLGPDMDRENCHVCQPPAIEPGQLAGDNSVATATTTAWKQQHHDDA